MLKIQRFIFNPFQVSTFVVYDTDSKEAVVVDPGMLQPYERAQFDEFIKNEGLRPTLVVNTHMHLDHCFGDNYVRSRYGVKVAASMEDDFLGRDLTRQASRFGIVLKDSDEGVKIDIPLADGDTIDVGSYKLYVLAVPGHSPGSIALYSPEGPFVIAGDALFKGSIGRTDLEGSDSPTLLRSIREKLYTLPAATTVLPGHDRFTTIGEEKAGNPYTL